MRKLLVAAFIVMSSMLLSPVASAVTVVNCATAGVSAEECSTVNQNDLDYQSGASRIWSIISIVLGVLAGVAVIMIVIGGIKYATSQGDSSSLTSAKNTILYSVIGLVVALLSSAIVLLVQSYFLN